MVARTILHVDMDAFFVSVELRSRPDLLGQPVVVGGTGRRGVVAAASYEARRYGVHSALPSAIARQRCPHAVFLPGDHELYSEVSAQVRQIFERYTPLIEPLSLDEAFLDVTGSRRLFGDGETIGAAIRSAVENELDLTCSVGVAPNKFLAKLASVEAKPHATPAGIAPGEGVVSVAAGAEREFLDPLPVERLWGVGPKTLQRLHRLGVVSVADLTRVGTEPLRSALGRQQAGHLAALAVGHDDRPVEPDRETKSISHEETYASSLRLRSELRSNLVRLADAVAGRLRAADLGARTVTLKVRFDDGFHTITRSTSTTHPVDQAEEIVALVDPMLELIDPTPGVRLVGVATSGLGQMFRQLSLEDAADQREPEATGDALDAIRSKFGADAIGPASAVRSGRVHNVKRGAQQWGPNQS